MSLDAAPALSFTGAAGPPPGSVPPPEPAAAGRGAVRAAGAQPAHRRVVRLRRERLLRLKLTLPPGVR